MVGAEAHKQCGNDVTGDIPAGGAGQHLETAFKPAEYGKPHRAEQDKTRTEITLFCIQE